MRRRRAGIGAVVAAPPGAGALLLAPVAPAHPRLAGPAAAAGSYVGVLARGGTVEFAVDRDRVIPKLSVVEGVPSAGANCDGSYGDTEGPFRIGPDGRFYGNYASDEGMVVRGRVRPGGGVTGHVVYEDRGGCYAADSFVARRVRGLSPSGAPLLNLYGGDGAPAGLARTVTRDPPATRAGTSATDVAQLTDGSLVVADSDDSTFAAIVGVDADGRARRLGGGAADGPRGDGGPLSAARFSSPDALAALPDGGYLIADDADGCVRRVSSAGVITVVAGICTTVTPEHPRLGDGGPATSARLSYPGGLAVLPDGSVLIADPNADRVREVDPGGIIHTVAGTGAAGFSGDGGPATSARLSDPEDVATLPTGGFVIADGGNGRVRAVAPDGTITTLAGGGRTSLTRGIGDGGPATEAMLATPSGVLALPGGGVLVADSGLALVREISPGGTIATIAGGGPLGSGPATDRRLTYPAALATLSDGGVAIGDAGELDELGPPSSSRLLIGLAPGQVRVDRRRGARVTVTSTVPARLAVAITAVRHRRTLTVRRLRAEARGAVTRLPVPALAPGAYRLRVTATAGPRIATASVPVRVR